MFKFIEALLGCTISLIGFWFLSDYIFQKKSSKNLLSFLTILFYAVVITTLNVVERTSANVILKVMMIFIMMIFFNRQKYKEKISDVIIGTLIVYLNLYLAEVVSALLLSALSKIININLFTIMQYSFLMNLITTSVACALFTLLKKLYIKLFRNIKYYNLSILMSGIVVLLIVTILVARTPIEQWTLNTDFITTMILIVLFCFIGIYMIKQKSEIDGFTDKYTKLAQYSKNEEGLLEEYRMMVHDNKNHLIAIDNMIPKECADAHDYIANLLNKTQNNKYYWLTELKFVPSPELKGFMNYKILEMMNEKIDVEINISREIKKSSVKNYSSKDKENLYSIIGIYLDNAREAASESKEKSVSIQMYVEDNNIKLVIANTFKGDIDLEKIEEYGYSSKKGINRGNGLHIVNEIISRNNLFEKETGILDNYFYQELTIHPKK